MMSDNESEYLNSIPFLYITVGWFNDFSAFNPIIISTSFAETSFSIRLLNA